MNDNARLGIILKREARGRGLAAEALAGLMDHAFGAMGIHKLYLNVLTSNDKGIHVYEKMGFVKEGVLRAEYKLRGEYRDMVRMSVLAIECPTEAARVALRREHAVRILAISGSLRARSSNTALLGAARTLAPKGVEVVLYEGLGGLPHFNADHDGDAAPPAVADFRSRVRAADGVLISSPEYAHGVPGTLKNALDWLVGGHQNEIVGKPVALFNASPRAGRRLHVGGMSAAAEFPPAAMAFDSEDSRAASGRAIVAVLASARFPGSAF